MKVVKLLKESNAGITVEKLYIRRTAIAVLTLIISFSTFVYMHALAKHNLIYAEPANSGALSVRTLEDEELIALKKS